MLLKHAKPIQSINNQSGESLREQDRVGYHMVCNMTIMCGSTLKHHGISPYYYNQIHFTCMYRHLYLTTSTLHHCHFDQHHGQGGRLSIWGLGGQSFKFWSLKLGWPVNPPTWRFATDLTDPTSVYCDWGGCGMNYDMAFCCDVQVYPGHDFHYSYAMWVPRFGKTSLLLTYAGCKSQQSGEIKQ